MQRMTMVRYATKPDATAENERLSRAVFDQVRSEAPAGVAYALFRNDDEFVHLFVNLRDDNSDVITETSSFRAYQADLPTRIAAPPEMTRLSVDLIDSYGFTTG